MSTAKVRLKTAMRRTARLLPRKPRPAILMYHRIGSRAFDPWGLAVEAERFAKQIDWLASNRMVLPLSEFAQLHQAGALPSSAVALTFDDGYASVLEAVPLLERHKLHATVFLPIDLIERGEAFWWDELATLIVGWKSDTLEMEAERLPVPPPHQRDRQWAPDTSPHTPRQRLFQTLWSRFHAMRAEAQAAAIAHLRTQSGVSADAGDRPLTSEQVRSIDPAAIAFGSHGMTHPSLPKLGDAGKRSEIAESRSRCKALTGTAPDSFAYPFGDLDGESMSLIEEAGYACACATGDTFVDPRSHRFALPRLRVGNWDVAGLRDMLGQ